jgi:NlpC/P60 family putative phage cell wall peptidase
MSADIVEAARGWVRTPYRHRAAVRGVGCDCIGLLRGVWAEVIGAAPELPPYRADWRDGAHSAELRGLAERWLVPAEIAPGAVLLFRIGAGMAPRHCGIFVGEGRFVHAQERLGVVEGNLTEGWARRVVAVLAFPASK